MSYSTQQRVARRGLMGLGAADVAAPIRLGEAAKTDGILSYASLWASNVMGMMARVPPARRVGEMERILNAMWPGMGTSARADYTRYMSTHAASEADQAAFDSIRLALASRVADYAQQQIAARSGISGLGSSVDDIRATGCLISGVATQGTAIIGLFQPAGEATVALSHQAGVTGGCDVAAIQARGIAAAQMANATSAGTVGMMAQQAASDARTQRFMLMGGGMLGVLLLGYIVVKKL